MAHKLARYLGWLGYSCKVFNVGNYRRSSVGANVPASFFDPENSDGMTLRRNAAIAALKDLITWSNRGGQIGIYDATNSTSARRAWVEEALRSAGIEVLFIESICEDTQVIDENIRSTKLRSPDYADVDEEPAIRDFRERISFYGRAYEPIENLDLAFVKIIDVGHQLVLNRIRGYVPGRIVNLLMNLHVRPRPIWIARHGQSLANLSHRVGGDEDLSILGREFARRLAHWIEQRQHEPVVVWTSTLQRTLETAHPLSLPSLPIKALDEIDAGICDGMTYDEIAAALPDEWRARSADKLRYRYPQGESYEDVIRRIDPVIIELERQLSPILIIAHQAVLRTLYGYLNGTPREDIPYLSIPLHTVLELHPRAYGCTIESHVLGPEIDPGSSS